MEGAAHEVELAGRHRPATAAPFVSTGAAMRACIPSAIQNILNARHSFFFSLGGAALPAKMLMQVGKKILYPLHSALRETQQWIVAT
jgi:hypothetical protein